MYNKAMRYVRKNRKKAITKILNGVKRGEKNKMDELFKLTFNHFYGYAHVKLWDKSKAEDAVMSMYENVMKYIGSFDGDRDGYTWMYTIISRIIYKLNAEALTTGQYEQLATEDDMDLADINNMYDAPGLSGGVTYMSDIDLAAINRMYETLGLSEGVAYMDDIDRKIVYLYYFEQRTLEETAAALDLSVSAVHKRKQQILKSLKKYLK